MERVAIITGGARGIGATIERCLKVSGYTAAAIYHGNAAAEAFGSKPQSPSASVTLPRRGNTVHRQRPIRSGG